MYRKEEKYDIGRGVYLLTVNKYYDKQNACCVKKDKIIQESFNTSLQFFNEELRFLTSIQQCHYFQYSIYLPSINLSVVFPIFRQVS